MMQSWYWLDYVIAGVLILSLLTGLIRGFFKELISLAIWVLAGWFSLLYAKPVAALLGHYIQDGTLRLVVSYVVIIVGTLFAGGLCSSFIGFIMQRTGLTGTDRLLGFVFGAIRGVLVVSLFMVVFRLTGMPEEEYQKKSTLYKHFEPIVSWMYQYAPDIIKHVSNFEQDSQALMDQPNDIEIRNVASL